jgi:hypothetical protein
VSLLIIRRLLRNLVVHRQAGFDLLSKIRRSEVYLSPETEVLIEGYPRSGNSFAEAAFVFAQRPREVVMAHHAHAAGHVLAALAANIPAVVLFRDPVDAAASFIEETEGGISAGVALKEYVQFHEPLLARQSEILFVSFEDVTNDFPSLIRRLNAKFGTDFSTYEHTDENVAKIRALVDEISLKRTKKQTRYSATVDQAGREARRAELQRLRKDMVDSDSLAAVLRDARAMHQRLLQLGGAGDS